LAKTKGDIEILNNTEFRASTSISSEINRLVRGIESHRAEVSGFYEELRTLTSNLKSSVKGADGMDEKKRRFKRIGVLLDELREEYWNLNDLLLELIGFEVLESSLHEKGTELSNDLVGILKQLEPSVRNASKALHDEDLGSAGSNLNSIIEDSKFYELNEVLIKLVSEIDQSYDKLKQLKQKRIL
jgi:ATP-dependent exoDNAse (exonuclease V) beta subunit